MKNEKAVPPFTLGWELEATRKASGHVEGIEAGHDGSVGGDSIEYRVQKKLVHDPIAGIRALRKLVSDPSLEVDASCGFHVHIGLGRRTRHAPIWASSFVALARMVEETAFTAVPASRVGNQYCREWRRNQGSVIQAEYRRDKAHNPSRYHWLNVVEMFRPGGIRTVEVRLMGDTKRYVYLLGWVALCRLMAASAWRISFDPSALPLEAAQIKSEMKRFSDCIRIDKSEAIRKTLSMAAQTGLGEKRIRPLAGLVDAEIRSRRGRTPTIGDTVECVKRDPEHNTTVGNCYFIDHVSFGRMDNSVRLAEGDDGRGWWVPADCLRVVRPVEVAV